MKKGVLIALGIIKIVLGGLLVGLGSAIGWITIILGFVWLIMAFVQQPKNGNAKISEVALDSKMGTPLNDESNQEVY